MTTQELINYYANLLIIQYRQKPKAYAMIQALVTPVVMPQASTQEINFSLIAVSGVFVLSYDGVSSANINWNDSASTIESTLQAITGLSMITVTGDIATQSLVVTFTGVTPPALPLVLVSSSLVDSGGDDVEITIAETDVTMPVAVQNAYNLSGTLAIGAQLDVIGKYAGVSRNGSGFQGQPISLDDADFLQLIRFATILNSAGSSLSVIQDLLNTFFADNIFVFDYQNMHMDYMIDSSVGTVDFAQMIVVQNLLPRPMGVLLGSVIYAPDISHFFGFRTYYWGTYKNSPFNSYIDYESGRPWLSYSDALVVGPVG